MGCLFKTALFGLGLYQAFTVSYLDPKAPTKALLPMDGCRFIVAELGGDKQETSYSTILLISL